MNRKAVAITASEVVFEVTARGRRAHHVSPYKKALNKSNNAVMQVINDPSDANIRNWASKILTATIGSRALKLTPADINEIRTVALLLKDIDTYSAQEAATILLDAGKYSANNAQDQMEKLVSKLKSASDKEQLSTDQLSHDKIGNNLLMNQDKDTSVPEFVNTNRGLH